MYSTEYCSDCRRAKSFFEANNIEYLRVALEDNEEATQFVMAINHGNQSVPTIIFPNGTILVEPSWKELQEVMEKIDQPANSQRKKLYKP